MHKHGIACSGEHGTQNCTVRDPKFAEFPDRDPAIEECLFKLQLKVRDLFSTLAVHLYFFRFL